jgi:hypothetical protein
MAKFKANFRLVESYQYTKLKRLFLIICAIPHVKYWLNIDNITKKHSANLHIVSV